MRRNALEKLVIATLSAVDDDDRNDVRDVLLAEFDENPGGAFDKACNRLDPDGDATREQVAAAFTKAFGLISDRAADRIEAGSDGWVIVTAIIRDEL